MKLKVLMRDNHGDCYHRVYITDSENHPYSRPVPVKFMYPKSGFCEIFRFHYESTYIDDTCKLCCNYIPTSEVNNK